MPIEMLQALLIPFMGTVLGAGCVFFIRGNLHWKVERAFTGFAAGVMVAASIWSLIIPAMEQSKAMDRLAFLPALVGFWFGVLFVYPAAGPHHPPSAQGKQRVRRHD